MATYTNHYEMTKQQSPERVSVGLLNDNFDIIDGVMFTNQEKADQMANDYNASETYNTGDYVRRENYLYKCNTDNTTGTWDATKWDRVKVMDEISQGGGGGSSTLAGLDDVSLATPTDGQLLGYNGTSHKWENVNGGGGGSSTFAGLNDVNVAGVANKDIARFNSSTNKWEKSSDLTDLELSVSQLSSSVLSIAGDVDTLELTVSQMSASRLPYDANTNTKQKIDNVESSIPTSASDLPYSSSKSTKQAIDEVNNNIPQLLQAQFALPSSVTIPVGTTVVVLNHFDITNSSIQDGLHDGKTLAQLLGGKKILGFVFLYSNGSACCGVDAIVWESENTISLAIKNVSSASADVWAIRALIFYK